MNEMETVSLFLMDRDNRVEHQEELLKKYKGLTLATVRINYPGVEKSNYVTDSIAKIICKEISTFYKKHIIYTEEYKNREGYIGHFIFNVDHITIKKLLIELEENHVLGRCVDLDVYYLNKNETLGVEEIQGISRKELNLSPRKCFLCDEEARICSRAQNHTFKDIKRYFEEKLEEYNLLLKEKEAITYEVSQYALKAMIAEVSTMPSFGLVSPCTMGSHKDMDYYTFIDSSFAIAPYLKDMAMIGYSFHQPKDIFEAIRFIGMDCEEAMFRVTKGVNTHKGMIFLLGIIVAATTKAIYDQCDFHYIEHILKEMCANILDDFKDIQDKGELTHGERLFKEYGFTGVRGEVKTGLPVVFKEVLPTYLESNLSGHALYAQTLLELMARVEDSTIVHRQDIHKLREIQGKSKEILKIGGLNSEAGIEGAIEFEKECIKANVSPGGSADLLALIIFLGEVYNKYFK